jgi:hypothetical protein
LARGVVNNLEGWKGEAGIDRHSRNPSVLIGRYYFVYEVVMAALFVHSGRVDPTVPVELLFRAIRGAQDHLERAKGALGMEYIFPRFYTLGTEIGGEAGDNRP